MVFTPSTSREASPHKERQGSSGRPSCDPAGTGEVLVRVGATYMSVGTEMSGVRASDAPLWKRALKDHSKVRRAVDHVFEKGISQTVALIRGRLAEVLVGEANPSPKTLSPDHNRRSAIASYYRERLVRDDYLDAYTSLYPSQRGARA